MAKFIYKDDIVKFGGTCLYGSI